jgi:NitT/TauT family transport system permease protein
MWFLRRGILPFWGILLLLVLWQGWVTVFQVNRLVMPSPAAVFGNLARHPTAYLPDFLATLKHAGLGLVVGMTLGLLLAIATWFSPILGGMVSAPAIFLRATPIAAMTPVIARMFGYNENSVIAVAILISFFPTYVFVASGLTSVSASAGDVFSVLSARRLTRLRRLAMPSAVPSLLLSLRISAPTAVLGGLVAEWLIGAHGLGALLSIAGFTYKVDVVWAGAILGTVLAVAGFAGASWIERVGRERWT